MFSILATLLGLVFAFSGFGKVQQNAMQVASAEKLGYTSRLKQIGMLEILGGVAALVFSWTSFKIIAALAIVGLNLIMAGAVVFHVKGNDAKGSIPAVVLFVLGCVALATIPA